MTRGRRVALLFVSAALLSHGVNARAQSQSKSPAATPPYRARLLGVFDEQSGTPVEGAEVRDLSSGLSALTTTSGTVALGYLPEGTSLVGVRKIGYVAQMFTVTISPVDTVGITIVLRRGAELSAVRITESRIAHLSPNLRAFEERRRSGQGGYFVTDSILRRSEDQPLANLLASRVPGLFVERQGRRSVIRSSRLTGLKTRCYPDIYLDGTSLGSALDLGEVEVATLAGIEFYPGGASVPAQYNRTGSDCGVLLLWTRER
jgi:hypothetical protein